MAKLSDYSLKKLGQDAVDFFEDTQDIINLGKVAHPIVSAVPAWTADNGEMAFYDGSSSATLSGKRIYVRLSSSWEVFATAPFIGFPGGPEGAVQFTSGGSFGGEAQFIYDSSRKSLDIFGHTAIGSDATVDQAPASIWRGFESVPASGARQVINVFESFSDPSVRINNGLLCRIATVPTSGSTDWIMTGLGVEVLKPAGHVQSFSGMVGMQCGVTVYGPGSFSALRGGKVFLRMASTSGAFTGDFYGMIVEVDDDRSSVSDEVVGFSVVDLNGNPSPPMSPRSKIGVFVGAHYANSNIVGADNTYNIYSLSDQRNKAIFSESQNVFEGPIVVGNKVGETKSSFYLRNFGASQWVIVGSGFASGSANQTTVNGSGTIFQAEFMPGVSGASFPSPAWPGLFLEASGLFLIVSSINSQTVLTLAEPIPSAFSQRPFNIRRPSVLIYDTGSTITDWPSVGGVVEPYPFVVCQGEGRVGVNDPYPTESLSVRGNIKVSGNITASNYVTVISTTTRSVGTFFTTTAIGVSSNNTNDTTLIRGVIGTTSLVANTLSDGRTIRLQAWGYYNTAGPGADALAMRVKLGGVTVLTTSSRTPVSSVSTGGWALNAQITCLTTGGAGTVFAQGDFPHFSSPTDYVNWQMVNSSTIVINTTGANVVEITAQWAGASSASQLFLTNAVGELLN